MLDGFTGRKVIFDYRRNRQAQLGQPLPTLKRYRQLRENPMDNGDDDQQDWSNTRDLEDDDPVNLEDGTEKLGQYQPTPLRNFAVQSKTNLYNADGDFDQQCTGSEEDDQETGPWDITKESKSQQEEIQDESEQQ